jgi:hypothetical protein
VLGSARTAPHVDEPAPALVFPFTAAVTVATEFLASGGMTAAPKPRFGRQTNPGSAVAWTPITRSSRTLPALPRASW